MTKNYEIVHLDPSANLSDIRELWRQAKLTPADPLLWSNSTSVNWTDTNNDSLSHVPYEAAIVYDMNEIILTNLRHYQEYNIEVCTLFK